MKLVLLIIPILCFGCGSTKNVHNVYLNKDIYNVDFDKSKVELIANTLAQFPNHSEIAIAIFHSNNLVFYGFQRTNDSIRITQNSNRVFEIGSITKVFTTQLLINLLDKGKIKSLDESVLPYLDFNLKGNPNITFRQLSNHTSGLPSNLTGSIFNTDASNPYKNWNKEKLVDYFSKDVKLDSEPGLTYQYSNIGMALLAYTICNIEEKGFEYLLQENIFQPLEMTQSTTDRYLIQDYLVQGYNWKGKPTANWDMAEMKGAGAVLSSTHDLSKYVLWNFNALKSQLKLMSQSTKVINDDLEIALGWHIIKNKTTDPFLWHNGGTGGYKSSMAINLFNDTGVIILTNIGATDNPKKGLIDNLCFELMKTSGSNFTYAQQELLVDQDTIPFMLSAFNNIIVKTVINGIDTLDLKFDSGTTGLLLTNNAIDTKLHWTRNSNYDNSLKIGDIEWDSLRIYPVELSGQGTDGRFGWDLFAGKVVEIDFDSNLLIVHNKLPTIDQEYARFNIEYTHTLFCIQAELEVKGIKYKNRFLFDNGYQRTIMLDTVLIAEQNFPKDLEVIKTVIMRDGQGKEIPVITVNLEKLNLGNHSLIDIPIQLLTTSNPARFKAHILGNEVLKRFNTFLDFKNNFVYLKPNSLINQDYKDEK